MRGRTMMYFPGVIACLAMTMLASGCRHGLHCGTGAGPYGGGGDLVSECGCGECGDVAFPSTCGSCATGSCGGMSGLFLPLMSTKLACGSGCGGVYWGEWMNDPPECCDPCTDCGCWVEPRCCGHQGVLSKCWNKLHHAMHVCIHGYKPGNCFDDCCGEPCASDCGGCGGCDGCSGGGYADGGAAYMEDGVPIPIEEMPAGPSTPAEVTQMIRHKHGRSPHPVVSRRMHR